MRFRSVPRVLAAGLLAAALLTAVFWPASLPHDHAGDAPADDGLSGAGASGFRSGEPGGGGTGPAGAAAPGNVLPEGERPNPKREMEAKRQLVERDAALTARLCIMQCSADLARMADDLSRLPAAASRARLAALRAGHPRMALLSWVPKDGDPVRAGGLPGGMGPRAEKEWAADVRKAERAVADGKPYDSGLLPAGRDAFVLLGRPHPDGGGIVGLVRQSLPARVKAMQRENLRLLPYPQEGRYPIESVDSNTHRDITVDHGEENGTASHYHKQEVVVRFAAPPGPGELEQIVRDLAISNVRRAGYAFVFQSGRTSAEEMIAYFRQADNVVYAEPHYLYMTNGPMGPARAAGAGNAPLPASGGAGPFPNDLLFDAYQWNLPIIGTIPGWSITRGNDNTIVAVIDTGIDLAHADLQGRLAEGMNFVAAGEAPADDVGHGTHVAGVIAAVVNNAEGVAGMTWHDRVMPVKVLDATGAGSAYAVAQGIIWATDNGAGVINLSLGNYARSAFLHDAVRYAFDRDVVLVAATGNDNTDQPGYPAAYPEVLAVSATDGRRRLADFSNYGEYVDVVAPGVGIASTYPGNQYAALSGTSMASPHAAALAALIRSVNPLLRNTEVMDIIRRTAIDLGPPGKDPLYGHGQIDVAAALAEAVRLKQSIGLYPEWVRREIAQWEAAAASGP